MEGKDKIKDLFSEKLSSFESDVNPDLWNAISSKINSTPPSVSLPKKGFYFTKSIMGAVAAISVGMIIYYSLKTKNNPLENKNPSIDKQQSIKTNNETPLDTFSVLNKNEQLIPNNKFEKYTPIKSIDHSILDFVATEEQLKVDSIKRDNNLFVQSEAFKNAISIPETQKGIEEIIVSENSTQDIEKSTDKSIKEEDYILNNNDISPIQTPIDFGTLPNIFTPNNDRVNDVFELNTSGISDFNIVIINNINQTVFTSSSEDFNWDGTGLNGDKVPVGDYVYYITGKDNNGKAVYNYSLLRIEY